MANYYVTNLLGGTQQNLTTTYKTLVSVVSSATVRRTIVYELIVAADGTPADNTVIFDVSRQTAAGTSTSVTPLSIDSADAAAVTTCTANSTVEPTITASSSVWNVASNQRATYRWVATPGCELIGPATSAAGFALRARSPAYTSTAFGAVYFTER